MPAKKKKPNAFVIMTFDEEFNAIYERLIRPGLEESGYSVKRADTDLNQQNIMKDVVRGIHQADLVVADLTDNNPNVFYELGLAHGLGRRTVLITQALKELPFDLAPYRAVEYSRFFDRAFDLKDELKTIGAALLSGEADFGSPVTDFLSVQVPEPPTAQRVGTSKGPTKRPSRKKKEATARKVVERGFFDWLAEMERSSTDFVGVVRELGVSVTDLGNRLSQRTEELTKEQASPGVGRAMRIKTVVETSAGDIDAFSTAGEDQLERYRRTWSDLAESMIAVLTSDTLRQAEDRSEVSALRPSMVQMREASVSSLGNIRKFRDSLSVLRQQGLSFRLTQATKRAVDLIDELLREIENTIAGTSRMISLIDDLAGSNDE